MAAAVGQSCVPGDQPVMRRWLPGPGRERPLSGVPRPVLALMAAGLFLQLLWHAVQPPPQARAEALPAPPRLELLQAMSLGEPTALAKILMLWLQAFDNPPGVSIPFRDLDYGRVQDWLDRILDLDPRGQYPLLAAARLYGEVPVEYKQRLMAEFVHRRFLEDPDRRWPWLAHAVLLAKHRLGDLELALGYARALAEHATGEQVPAWARQMHIFVLEDMGEVEAARILIGGLLDSGTITDPQELAFLRWRLEQMERGQTPGRR